MNESDIIETISSFKPEPGEKFRSDFLGLLHNLDESVTNSPQHRTRFLDSFKFSLLSVMNTKLSTTAVVAVIAIVLLGGAGTTYASDSAAPGDFLFPIDKAVEGVQRVFTFSAVSKSEFELEVMEERVLELEEVSDGDSSDAVADAIDEVEGQQLRIREQLRIMDELRLENKLQNEEQQQVMQKIQEKVQEHNEIMNQVQTKLQNKNDSANAEELNQVQNQYSEEMGTQIQNFEEETGLTIQESEQNQGEDTQIQNQNEVQNQGEDTGNPDNGNGDSSGSDSGSGSSGSGSSGSSGNVNN